MTGGPPARCRCPGKTMGQLAVVDRDYPALADKWETLGSAGRHAGTDHQGRHRPSRCGGRRPGRQARGDGSRRRRRAAGDRHRRADGRHHPGAVRHLERPARRRGFRELERRTGRRLVHLAEGSEERRITYADTQARPVPVITSPEWSGSETGGRRYAPFTVNVEELKPWHTLTGRMHFYLDHDWIEELGEQLPVYRPPLDMARLFGEPRSVTEGIGLSVRYLTPHSKWSIHSEYQDNLFMLSLSRGGPTMWMSPADAAKIGVHDNDWVEAVNRNGVMVCRPSSPTGCPRAWCSCTTRRNAPSTCR